jgi:hypothetical protein
MYPAQHLDMPLELTMNLSPKLFLEYGDKLSTLINDSKRSFGSLTGPSLIEWVISTLPGLLIAGPSTYVKPKKQPSTNGTYARRYEGDGF